MAGSVRFTKNLVTLIRRVHGELKEEDARFAIAGTGLAFDHNTRKVVGVAMQKIREGKENQFNLVRVAAVAHQSLRGSNIDGSNRIFNESLRRESERRLSFS